MPAPEEGSNPAMVRITGGFSAMAWDDSTPFCARLHLGFPAERLPAEGDPRV